MLCCQLLGPGHTSSKPARQGIQVKTAEPWTAHLNLMVWVIVADMQQKLCHRANLNPNFLCRLHTELPVRLKEPARTSLSLSLDSASQCHSWREAWLAVMRPWLQVERQGDVWVPPHEGRVLHVMHSKA